MYVSRPRCGSAAILYARAAKGSASLGCRSIVTDSSPCLNPMMAGTSSGGGGEVADHAVKQRLTALVLEGAATEHGGDLGGKHGTPDRILQEFRSDRLFVGQVGLHHVIVVIGHQLDQGMTCFLGLLNKFGGDLLDGVVLTDPRLTTPREGAHPDQVDDPNEVRLRADRQLYHSGYGIEPVLDRLHAVLEARGRTGEIF